MIDGKPVDPKRDSISFVFQEPSTLPWLNVWDNVATGLRIKKAAAAEMRRKVDEIIEIVGLRGYEEYFPHQISGGMKQRVAIARAFAIDADLILMDEPFVSLDQPTRERMQREVLYTWEHRRRTVVFVTHNIEEAVFLGDRVIVLSAKPARIIANLDVPLRAPRNPLCRNYRIRGACTEIMQSPTWQPAHDWDRARGGQLITLARRKTCERGDCSRSRLTTAVLAVSGGLPAAARRQFAAARVRPRRPTGRGVDYAAVWIAEGCI